MLSEVSIIISLITILINAYIIYDRSGFRISEYFSFRRRYNRFRNKVPSYLNMTHQEYIDLINSSESIWVNDDMSEFRIAGWSVSGSFISNGQLTVGKTQFKIEDNEEELS